jgi:hypothetical protein
VLARKLAGESGVESAPGGGVERHLVGGRVADTLYITSVHGWKQISGRDLNDVDFATVGPVRSHRPICGPHCRPMRHGPNVLIGT